MSAQTLIVVVVVAVAFAYAAWVLAPASLRRRFVMAVERALGGSAAPGMRGKLAARLTRVAAKTGGGCSDCAANVLTPAERNAPRNSSRPRTSPHN